MMFWTFCFCGSLVVLDDAIKSWTLKLILAAIAGPAILGIAFGNSLIDKEPLSGLREAPEEDE